MARSLMAMNDAEVRVAVAAGDLSPLGPVELDDEELRLLQDAARGEADDDVVAFGSFAPPYVPVGPNPALLVAVRHVEARLPLSPVQQDFTAWTAQLGAQGSW
jgi:hypothetical protein